jgi:site-specific DNA-methyltransferase (adenine-specific)
VLPINEIICGDNVATMQTFPDACIDLVVTSPPYDNLRTYGGHSWDFEGVAQQLWRVIKPGGVVVWVVADATIDGSETGTSFRQALRFMEIGFRLHDTMIYLKAGTGMAGSLDCYIQAFEFMFVLSSGKPAAVNILRDRQNARGGTINRNPARRNESGEMKPNRDWLVPEFGRRVNVWQYGHKGVDCGHPGVFPESLARDHILSWSNENDIVLDPFSGSGTTAKMARLMGRQYIGIEINPEYCEIAKNRLRQKVLEFSVDSAEGNR